MKTMMLPKRKKKTEIAEGKTKHYALFFYLIYIFFLRFHAMFVKKMNSIFFK